MKFYRLFREFNPEVVGMMPQLFNPEGISSIESKHYLGNLFFEKITDAVEVPTGHLHRKAKLTDWMVAGFLQKPLISGRLYNMLPGFKIEGLEFVRGSFYQGNSLLTGYYYINPYRNFFEILDLKTTGFATMTNPLSKVPLDNFRLQSYDEVTLAFAKQDKSAIENGMLHQPLFIAHLAFREGVDADFFALRGLLSGGIGFFVSDKLRKSMVEAGITGIVFREINETYP